MISNLHVLPEELRDQTLRYSTRELLQHWTESSRIPPSRKRSVWRKWELKKKTASSEEDRWLTWSTSTSGSLEPMIPSRIMPTYLVLFFEILESLYKLRIRESEKLNTLLELYKMEIHHKKAGPNYHRLKTMVKRSIEQNLRMKNFDARNGIYEASAVVKNQGTKQRGQRILGDCWQWETNGHCSKGDNCSFRHDVNKHAKMTQPNPSLRSSTQQSVRNASRTPSPRGRSPSGRMFRWPCKDYLKGTCTTPFCEKWHPPECLFYKSEKWMQIWGKVLLCTPPVWWTA